MALPGSQTASPGMEVHWVGRCAQEGSINKPRSWVPTAGGSRSTVAGLNVNIIPAYGSNASRRHVPSTRSSDQSRISRLSASGRAMR